MWFERILKQERKKITRRPYCSLSLSVFCSQKFCHCFRCFIESSNESICLEQSIFFAFWKCHVFRIRGVCCGKFFQMKENEIFGDYIFLLFFFSNPDNLQCTSSSTPLVDNFFLNSLITFIFFHHVLPFSLFFSFDCSMDHIDVVLLVCLRSEFFFLEIFLLDRFSNAWTKALWNRFNQADPSTYRRSSTSTSTASVALFSFVFPSAHYSVFRNFHHRKNRDIERERVGRKKIIK